MALYLEKPTRHSNWLDLWGKVTCKLMIYVVELKDVIKLNHKGYTKDIKSELSLKFEYGSSKTKTEELKMGQTMLNQILFMDISEFLTNSGLQLIARVRSGGSVICEASLGQLDQLRMDTVVEKSADLFFPLKEKSKSSPADLMDRILGKVSVRLLFTRATGFMEPHPVWSSLSTIPPGSGFGACTIHDGDKSLRKIIKTGDLVIFHEGGLPGHLLNLSTNSLYSRVGMILRVPDKYTGKPHLFVVELTSNPQKCIDVFREEPTSGVAVFKLWERLYSLQGGSAWLLPLLEPIAADPMENLIDMVHKIIESNTIPTEGTLGNASLDLISILQEMGMKDWTAYMEIFSGAFCAGLLRMGGRRFADPPTLHSISTAKDASGNPYTPGALVTPLFLTQQKDVFGPLIPLRTEQIP